MDTGSQISLLTEEMHENLISEGLLVSLVLGVQSAVLASAFENKTKNIRVKAMMQICVDKIFLISPDLLTQALLGVDFCRMNNVVINFTTPCFGMERDGKVSRHLMAYANSVRSVDTGDLGPTDHRTNTGIQNLQVVVESMTNRAMADYSTYSLRTGAGSEVDAFRSSDSKDNIKM
jgi:hypothetical protein